MAFQVKHPTVDGGWFRSQVVETYGEAEKIADRQFRMDEFFQGFGMNTREMIMSIIIYEVKDDQE